MERLRDFFDVFEARNIANDQQLSEAMQIARKAIAGATVEELRDDEALRAQVKAQFEEAASVFDAIMADNSANCAA